MRVEGRGRYTLKMNTSPYHTPGVSFVSQTVSLNLINELHCTHVEDMEVTSNLIVVHVSAKVDK